jgi:hypothetical protein
MAVVVEALETEWGQVASSRLAREALERWSEDPALWGFRDLDELVEFANRRRQPAASDRVLAALARRARTDDLAARTLLQAVLPGLKSIIRTYGRNGTNDEVGSAVIAIAFERIRCYPIARRPEHVAANILLDTRQAISRRRARDVALREATGEPADVTCLLRVPARSERSASDELVHLVAEAVQRGALSPEGARVIVLTRVADVPIAELATRQGEDARAVRQRRRRAELSLVSAAASAAVA